MRRMKWLAVIGVSALGIAGFAGCGESSSTQATTEAPVTVEAPEPEVFDASSFLFGDDAFEWFSLSDGEKFEVLDAYVSFLERQTDLSLTPEQRTFVIAYTNVKADEMTPRNGETVLDYIARCVEAGNQDLNG